MLNVHGISCNGWEKSNCVDILSTLFICLERNKKIGKAIPLIKALKGL